MNQIVLTGMVLSTTPVGEYDRRVVLLTKEQGKVSAFAKGSRRPNSPLVGVVNPFTFGEFTMYEGRSSYTIQSAKVINYFSELREDVLGAYYGFYFLEVANYYAREFNDELEMLKLLYQTMRALTNPHIPDALIRCIYELKILTINGEYPNVFSCRKCKKEEDLGWFSAKYAGTLCSECKNDENIIRLDESALYTMQYIITSSIEKLYTFQVSEDVLHTLERILKSYLAMYVDRKFKSLKVLEEIRR